MVSAACTSRIESQRRQWVHRRVTALAHAERAMPKSMISASPSLDHDVCGLQVAVNNAGLVRGRQTGDHDARSRIVRPTSSLPFSLEDRGEVFALEVGHRDVLDAVQLAEIVDADDVLVGDLPREQQLLLEAALERLAASGSAAASGRITFSATTTPSSWSQA